MLLFDHFISAFNKLLQEKCILFIESMHNIFVHKITIQILCFLIILFFSFFPLLINDFKSIVRCILFLFCLNVLDIFILLPIELKIEFKVSVILFVGLSSHA